MTRSISVPRMSGCSKRRRSRAEPLDVGICAGDRRIRRRQCVNFSQVLRCEQIVVGRDAEIWRIDALDQRVHVANPAEPFALHDELETPVMKVTPADGLRVIALRSSEISTLDVGEGLRGNAVERLGEEVRSIEDRHTDRDGGHHQPAAPTSAVTRSAVCTATAGRERELGRVNGEVGAAPVNAGVQPLVQLAPGIVDVGFAHREDRAAIDDGLPAGDGFEIAHRGADTCERSRLFRVGRC